MSNPITKTQKNQKTKSSFTRKRFLFPSRARTFLFISLSFIILIIHQNLKFVNSDFLKFLLFRPGVISNVFLSVTHALRTTLRSKLKVKWSSNSVCTSEESGKDVEISQPISLSK